MSTRSLLVFLAECEDTARGLDGNDPWVRRLLYQLAVLRRAAEADACAADATHRAILAAAEALPEVRRDPWLKAWATGLRRRLDTNGAAA